MAGGRFRIQHDGGHWAAFIDDIPAFTPARKLDNTIQHMASDTIKYKYHKHRLDKLTCLPPYTPHAQLLQPIPYRTMLPSITLVHPPARAKQAPARSPALRATYPSALSVVAQTNANTRLLCDVRERAWHRIGVGNRTAWTPPEAADEICRVPSALAVRGHLLTGGMTQDISVCKGSP